MARTNGRLTANQVEAWFDGLNIDTQRSVLSSLNDAHGKVRAKRIAELRTELDVLNGNPARDNGKRKPGVTVKYRNPATGETWSGRGRMASWLAAKVKAGEKVRKYLVG